MSKKHKRQLSHVAVPAATQGKPYEFNPDYSATKNELRRIGVLAGSFFVILIVLSFFQDKILALFVK